VWTASSTPSSRDSIWNGKPAPSTYLHKLLDVTQVQTLVEPASRQAYNPGVSKGGRHMAETRKVIDCRRFPAEKPCPIVISGTEDDVLGLAVLHATTVHGHQDTPELRYKIRSMLQDQDAATAEAA